MIKKHIKKILGIYDYDEEARRLLKKSISLYRVGGGYKKYRAIRIFNILRKKFNISIYPGIDVGENFYVAHAHGVLVGRTAKIGSNVKIYPNALIVAKIIGDEEKWKNGSRRHAIIGDNCIIGCDSKIIGPITIGNNVIVGAGAIVTKDVPDNSIVINVNEVKRRTDL